LSAQSGGIPVRVACPPSRQALLRSVTVKDHVEPLIRRGVLKMPVFGLMPLFPQHQLARQITSDFPKSCQPRKSKIFRFRSHPNQSHNSVRLTANEGRFAIVTNVR
jgi:hypothetical protein